MMTCPQCGFEQPETDECIKCGIIISKHVQFQEMARSYEGQVREISAEEYTPWESGEGFINAFYRTTRDSLFSPSQFFKKISFGEGYWAPFLNLWADCWYHWKWLCHLLGLASHSAIHPMGEAPFSVRSLHSPSNCSFAVPASHRHIRWKCHHPPLPHDCERE